MSPLDGDACPVYTPDDERAPQPPADLVQATQDGEHPAIHAKRVRGMKAVRMPGGEEAAATKEILRLRQELHKAVELLQQAAPRFSSYEECMDGQDQGGDCIAADGHWEHDTREKMDEFIERNKEGQ